MTGSDRTVRRVPHKCDRKRTEWGLSDSEQKFRALFVDSPVSIIVHDTETGEIVDANFAACASYGLSSVEELRQCHPWIEPPYSFEDALAWIRKTAAEGPQEFEWLNRKVTGELFWEKVRLTPITVDNVQHVLATGLDITAEKTTEDALRASEERLRLALENAPVVLFDQDRELRYTWVHNPNPGFRVEETLGKTDEELLPGAEAARLTTIKQSVLNTGVPASEMVTTTINGKTYDYNLTVKPLHDERGRIIGVTCASIDVTEKTRTQHELEVSHTLLQQVLQGTLDVIQQMTEARDPYTSGHQRRVAELAEAIAREMHLPEESCVAVIRTAAFIHDIGKITVPAEILSKPGQISPTEFELIKVHPTAGYNILRKAHLPDPVAETVLQHHERLDGSGYPQRLAGDDILPEAQILAVADVVEAMLSHRPYRPAPGIEAALEEISSGRGTRYYPDVVDACLTLFRDKGFSFSC